MLLAYRHLPKGNMTEIVYEPPDTNNFQSLQVSARSGSVGEAQKGVHCITWVEFMHFLMFPSAFWQRFNSEQAHTFGCGRVCLVLCHYNVSSEETRSVLVPNRGGTEAILSVNCLLFFSLYVSSVAKIL